MDLGITSLFGKRPDDERLEVNTTISEMLKAMRTPVPVSEIRCFHLYTAPHRFSLARKRKQARGT